MKTIFTICITLGFAFAAKAQQYQFKLNDSLKSIQPVVIPGIKALPQVSDLATIAGVNIRQPDILISPVDRMPVLALPVTDRMPVAKLKGKGNDKMPILKLQPLEQPLKPTP